MARRPAAAERPGARARRSSTTRSAPGWTAWPDSVRKEGQKLDDLEQRQDFTAAANRLDGLGLQIEDWRLQQTPEAVYWIEAAASRWGRRIHAGRRAGRRRPGCCGNLFEQVPTVIFTSATLATAGSFDFFKSPAGHRRSRTSCSLGSPFDYRRQAQLILLDGMPEPGADDACYEQKAIEMIRRYVERTDGRAFVLFTSYSMMKRAAAAAHRLADGPQPGPLLPGRRHAAEPDAGAIQGQPALACCSAPTVSGKGSTCPATRCKT